MSDDDTLGGYRRVHQRAPAFGGPDGLAYTVATFVDDTPDALGAGHLETDYLAFGPTPEEAEAPLLTLTLAEVKAHLDRCVAAAG